ncbi:elongation factor P maturation arginine rhamnosyltransferase EarP [Stutzerimonas nosocomialis]|uniref:elongation factor P maturation arginine rhamnosyltransferase EarP n=1 Tax=Stutzerimonas nosocomialis TaxID=1056496 RepID=UPI00110901C5|nr:elongation factor P maturation arginine rhamnosyltransferase EarP [Stutzerimonas nosocomialis]TLX57221.1 elongation factor P maturation arginine rhamnosyltransferase EarP [Stutzerimonas nosocomialis]
MPGRPLWDIFCAVVDNYGDIGVTWRLARQLVAEHGQAVRLWVDDLETFVALCPGARADVQCQVHAGVEVRHWPREWHDAEPGDVVIEAFACNLPPAYIQAMSESGRRILWLNLEYLSAEGWIKGCHGLPSLQPSGLQKYFFFPGFEAETGGLIRETGLLDERRAFQRQAVSREAFLGERGVTVPDGTQVVSLFAYENAAVAGWLDALAEGPQPTLLLVPVGRVLADVERWLGESQLTAGRQRQRGALQIAVLPFLTQEEYDRLLWCCDFNAVRGEESFIRAQWAGRPLVWHIYPQEEDAHWDKLRAFFELYADGLSTAARDALWAFWQAWNAGQGAHQAWRRMGEHQAELVNHAERWTRIQTSNGDLAAKLVFFYTDWL